jgi:L-seryl-tRNA(Ser) seleniumtransferase
MFNRRRFLESLGGLPLAGSVLTGCAQQTSGRDFFGELGVRTFLNAAGTYTSLTASLMPPEVMEAINYASRYFVSLNELHDAVGERLATLLDCESAMVTAGAASALTLGTAACLTGTDPDRIRSLPDTTGMMTEVIIQKTHRFGYDHAVRNCGVKLVEVETSEELEASVSDQTAMMLFLNYADPKGQIQREEFIALGKKYGVPTFNDAAADVPPPERLFAYTQMGFDLVTFSGGKGLRGPQSSGLLLGRKDLIQAARLNAPPNGDTIGRGMKVNKEEILGLMVAVERFLAIDPVEARRELDSRAEEIVEAVSTVPTVQTEIEVPEIANHVPHVHIWWNEELLGLTVADVVRSLRSGDPSIEVTPSSREHLIVNPFMLQHGESTIVAHRIRECLRGTDTFTA